MKLLLAVVQDQDAPSLLEALAARGYRATKLASTGGFLRAGNTTFLVGVEDEQVEDVVGVIREVCRTRERTITPVPPLGATGESHVPFPVEVSVGGATIFVVDVQEFIQI